LDLDGQSGVRTSGSWTGQQKGVAFNTNETGQPYFWQGDKGGASRFFTQTTYTEADWPVFLYYAKASKRERNQGLDQLEGKPLAHSNQAQAELKRGNLEFSNEKFNKVQVVKNFHPTVKPVELMRHLIRLVTPSGGKVLDPFLGSGTTAVAAILEGKDWIGCELTEDYIPIIEARIKWASEQASSTLF
jgi:tRNA G10  N-methylase Trm11